MKHNEVGAEQFKCPILLLFAIIHHAWLQLIYLKPISLYYINDICEPTGLLEEMCSQHNILSRSN